MQKTTTSTTSTTSSEKCACNANKNTHAAFSAYNNNLKTQYSTFVDQSNILNITSQLQELPVYAPAPGYQATYAPNKIPKGAVVVFMPVIILPEEAYANCNENNVEQKLIYQHNALGVQPAAIRSEFNSIFGLHGGDKNRKCMCPCSCSQNLPEDNHYAKKRETEKEIETSHKAEKQEN